MAAKKQTPQQKRDKRAKIMLAVLGVVLLILMAVEVPSLMSKKSAASSAVVAGAMTTTTAGAPTGGSTPAPAAAAGGNSLASASVVATSQPGQLTRFSRFAAKDPFHPLVSATSGTGTGGGTTTTPSSPKAGTPPVTLPSKPVGTPKTVTFTPKPQTTTPAQPTGPMVLGAVLQLNGVRRVVPVGTEFPQANPVFKLVAVGRKAMWISLVGGSFGGGDQALKVDLGHPVKLVDTTANLDFLLSLLKVKLVPKPAPIVTTTGSATTSSSSTSTSSTTTTTTTTTTSSG
jgi:hypothetical protein